MREETTNDSTNDNAGADDVDGTISSSHCSCSTPTSSQSQQSQQQQDTETECPICMEVFEVGDCVSWSASTSCNHVFHHDCIKEWLLRRIGCPYCRETFLPVDRQRGRLPNKVLEHMAKERAQRASFTYYCQVDGLVTLSALTHHHKKETNPDNNNVQEDDDENDNDDDDDDDVSLKIRPHIYLARRFLTTLRGAGTTRRQRRRRLRHELQANGNETGLEILASSTTVPQQQLQEVIIDTMPSSSSVLIVASSPSLRANSTFMEDDDDDDGGDDDHDDESPEEWNDHAVSETRVRRQLGFGDANQIVPNASREQYVATHDLEEGRILLLQQDHQSKPSDSDSDTVPGQSAENNVNDDHISLGSSGTIVFETEHDENENDDDDDTDSFKESAQEGSSRDEEMGMALVGELDMVVHAY